MFKVINIEDTPNPDAVKFILDKVILQSGTRQFDFARDAEDHPVAKGIFAVPGVASVFFSGRFVSVTKDAATPWNTMGPKILEAIQGAKVEPEKEMPAAVAIGVGLTGDALLDKINQVIDESVRPALAGDGGGLEVISLEGKNLTIRYQGACGSCPSAAAGTMGAIQNLLQRMVDPELKVRSEQAMMGQY